jgi:Uncharacterized protein conserved in bacteria (DUF2330)
MRAQSRRKFLTPFSSCRISGAGVFPFQFRLIQETRQIQPPDFMKNLMIVFLVSLFACFISANVLADGGFIVSKFVWDKHKDINEPTQKAIIVYDVGREDLILQVKYDGPVDEFGWLIPVPNLPTVQEGSMKCFYELSQFTQQHFEPAFGEAGALGMDKSRSMRAEPPPVKVIETKTVGAYEIAVLSATDSGALKKWLDANQFYFPETKSDVIDAYVKQHWYFVASRINLSKKSGFQLLSTPQQRQSEPISNYATHLKLASGELNPLQISFASDRCVFPLKISSINGKPSEVQVYVLSTEPLLEKTMLEKQLPEIYSNDMVRAQKRQQSFERLRLMERNSQRHFMGANVPDNSPLSVDDAKTLQKIRKELYASPDELLPFIKVASADLPDCSKAIPQLAGKSWWLTKQTWTFQPEEMQDLIFEPAFPVFADELATRYGYFAAASLASFGAESIPTIVAAMQSTNSTVRVNAASIFQNGGFGKFESAHDSRLTEAALTWLKDSEPSVRTAGVEWLTEYSNWNPAFAEPIVAILRDEKDAGVCHAAVFGLPRFRGDLGKFIPDFQQMLKSEDSSIQWTGLEMLERLQVEIPREDLLPFFQSSDWQVLDAAFDHLRDQQGKLSDDDAAILLQNPQPVAQLLGLGILNQNPERQSIELALPLLQAPDEIVRLKAAQTLRALTGQNFTEDQADEWGKWWMENKTNYVVQLHAEELRPRFPQAQ